MKTFAALALALTTLGLSQAASANFDHSLFARFKDPAQLSCGRGGSNPHNMFIVNYGSQQVSVVENLSYEQVQVMAAHCNAAIIQAVEGKNMIYVNVVDGTVMPDNGFFVQQPR